MGTASDRGRWIGRKRVVGLLTILALGLGVSPAAVANHETCTTFVPVGPYGVGFGTGTNRADFCLRINTVNTTYGQHWTIIRESPSGDSGERARVILCQHYPEGTSCQNIFAAGVTDDYNGSAAITGARVKSDLEGGIFDFEVVWISGGGNGIGTEGLLIVPKVLGQPAILWCAAFDSRVDELYPNEGVGVGCSASSSNGGSISPSGAPITAGPLIGTRVATTTQNIIPFLGGNPFFPGNITMCIYGNSFWRDWHEPEGNHWHSSGTGNQCNTYYF